MTKKRNVLIPNLADSDAEKEWVGMPEFIHKERKPFREIVIRFTNEKDIQIFAKKIKHTVTSKTKFIWFSKINFKGRDIKRRYIDES